MAGYLGAIPVPQATQHRESFTATAGQTTFNTAGYTVGGFLDVFLNGSHLSPADFVATNGSDVVLGACLVNDIVDVISYSAFELNAQTFTGTTTMDVVAIGGATTIATDKKLIFRDSAIHISSTADGDLSIAADDEIDITSTLIDINGAVDMSSTLATASTITVTTAASTKAGSFVGNGIEVKHPTGASNLFIGTQTGNDVKIASIGAQSMRFDTNGAERLKIDANGNVGIGTTLPDSPLTIKPTAQGVGSNNVQSWMYSINNGSEFDLKLKQVVSSGLVKYAFDLRNSGVSYANNLVLDRGNVLVGGAAYEGSSNSNASSAYLGANGFISANVTNDFGVQVNRTGTDGALFNLRKNGSDVGGIGAVGGTPFFANASTGGIRLGTLSGAVVLMPCSETGALEDNQHDVGHASTRWDDIHATNGTIQTSDANEKQDIASLTSAEMLVAKRISALFKTFRWKDKVAAKGANARTHTGIIAQDVQSAFTAESLDAGDYSLFISSTWWEHDVDVPAVEAVAEVTETTTDKEGNNVVTVTTEAVESKDAYTRTDNYDTEGEAPEGATSRTRLGIRYPELLSFVAAYNEQRFASIETRLTALEAE